VIVPPVPAPATSKEMSFRGRVDVFSAYWRFSVGARFPVDELSYGNFLVCGIIMCEGVVGIRILVQNDGVGNGIP
jgi:hypothetical protein